MTATKEPKPAVKSKASSMALVDSEKAELIKSRDRYFKVLQRSLRAAKGECDAAHHAAAGFLVNYSELYALAAEALFMESYRGVLAKLRRKEEAAGDALSPGRLIGEPADEVEDVVARAIRKHGPAKASHPAAKTAAKEPAAKK